MLIGFGLFCVFPLVGVQAEEIQANAAETLVNVTHNLGEECSARVHALGITPLVLMCGSDNLQVCPENDKSYYFQISSSEIKTVETRLIPRIARLAASSTYAGFEKR